MFRLKRVPSILLFILALIVGIAFQNCAAKKTGGSGEGSSSSNLPGPNPGGGIPIGPVGGPDFKVGEQFNYQHVPNKSQMVQVMLYNFGFYTHTGPKAVAIASDGLGFVAQLTGGTQDDANRMAQEACFTISGGKPCALIAVGPNFNINRSNLNNSYTFSIPATAQLAAQSLPFVASAARTNLVMQYLAATPPKALAVGLDGAFAWVSNTASQPIASLAEARRLVLERCEMMSAIVPCSVYAEDNTVVFNPTSINRDPQIDYARTALSLNIPGMRDGVYAGPITSDYLVKVNASGGAGVIYITADGRGGYAAGSSASVAETDSLLACNANKLAFPCFRYAVNKSIQSLPPNLAAIRDHSIEVHCQAVPRSSCAQHKAVGCPAGNYYVVSAGSISVQNCP